ncbi:hypothetical protein [Photobacterium leiognathi]|uniref:hypothetical protein n=1 Tax=Photobacterium leiognathi TaxID=553611 RepID=UPI00298278A4|nr:hypothetical protein [Photobacterium leiognathi]
MKLIIDLFSKEWVHSDFNVEYIKSYCDKSDIVVGNKGAEYLSHLYDIKGIKYTDGFLSKMYFLYLIFISKEVVFLVFLNKYFPLLVISRLFGKKTSYVIHKYNLTTRKNNKLAKYIYVFLEFIGVRSVSLEPPHDLFKKNDILNIDMWKGTIINSTVNKNKLNKIAFIGKPVPGKNFNLLMAIAEEINLEVVVYSDESDLCGNFEVKKFTDNIVDCELIWGFYDAYFYKGIQSGLCYPALVSGLRVLTNNNIGFNYFSTKYGNYLIECKTISQLKEEIKELM